MIIGLLGPVQEDIDIIQEMLTSDKTIQVVDAIEVLRSCDRLTMNSLMVNDYHKKFFLKKMETEFETVIITGNLLLSQEICSWILQSGGIVVVVARSKIDSYDTSVIETTEKYWGEKSTQQYELEQRFQDIYKSLSKFNQGVDNLFMVDLSDDDCEHLDTLAESNLDWMDSSCMLNSVTAVVDLVTVKGDKNMKMEDVIKKAMLDLGMDTEHPQVQDIEEPVKPKKKQPVKPKNDAIKKEEPTPAPKLKSEVENTEQSDSLFAKISGGTMALLIPSDLVMDTQIIGGEEFMVATVELPDLNNPKLQALYIKKPVVTEDSKLKSAPKTPTKSVSNPKKVVKATEKVEVSGDLIKLQTEKQRLDVEIKKYRELGDVETVNNLRKQRRAIRNKINSFKKA